MRVCLCAILRTENRYIEEWLDYHLGLGFDHVYLCDNAQDGEERVDEIVAARERYNERVSILPYYNKHSQQVKAYTECYNSLDFDWMAYIDIDEFMTFGDARFSDIHQYIETIAHDADEILLNWRTYGDCGLAYDDGRPCLDRFGKPLPDWFSPYNMIGKSPYNCHVKQILRKGLPLDKIMPHASMPREGSEIRVVDGDGCPILAEPIQPYYTFKTCYVRHFYTRTIEEYISTKIKRGMGVVNKNWKYDLSAFFMYNRVTPTKYKIYKEALKLYPEQSEKTIAWWIKQIIKMWIITPFLEFFYGIYSIFK